MSEPKKISFGFKAPKRPILLAQKPSVETKKVDYIDCLEGQSIKVIDAIEIDDKPLVIPVKPDLNRNKSQAHKQDVEEDKRLDSELTLDELAARQLLQEARNVQSGATSSKIYSLPVSADALVLEGSEESSLDDYENIPITDFGMAMLRGMGWVEGGGIGKRKKVAAPEQPKLRPKGLGLGAIKMLQDEKSKTSSKDKDGNELPLIKGARAKIISGKDKGSYCKIQGFDDESGRIIVKTAIASEILILHEFALVAVNDDEYKKYSKV